MRMAPFGNARAPRPLRVMFAKYGVISAAGDATPVWEVIVQGIDCGPAGVHATGFILGPQGMRLGGWGARPAFTPEGLAKPQWVATWQRVEHWLW